MTTARSVSAENVVCDPSSHPKNLVTSEASRFKDAATSETFTKTVLIPLPRPSTLPMLS